MDKAKAAVSGFVAKHGQHDTTVHESAAPAVQQEQVMPSRHENVQKAVDREVHQDHYHTTVQPVQDREVRPEVHHHQMTPVQEKKVSHEDHDSTKRKIEQQASQFRNTQTVHETKHTATAAPTVEGQRVHHHVHETIQPVVHKETITPEVVHTTVPVHETHHASAKHHGTSVLPVKHMGDFKSTGGSITGGTTTDHAYDGCPKPHDHSSQAATAGGDGKAHLPTPQPVHDSNSRRTDLSHGDMSHRDTSHRDVLHKDASKTSSVPDGEPWHAPSAVSGPLRGTDSSLPGESKNPELKPNISTRKTIEASGMDNFTSRY